MRSLPPDGPRGGIAARAALASRVGRVARLAVPAVFLGVFFVYPVASILGRGLVPGGHVDLGPLADVVGEPGLRRVAWFTLWQAVVSTKLTLALALPGAYVIARYRFPGRDLVRALVTVPFVLPTVVVGAAFLALLGRGGPLAALHLDRSVAAILLAHVFFNYAVVVRTVGSFWATLDPRRAEAARVLGASRWQVWSHVTLPLLAPSIAAAASIVFLFTFTSFGVVVILGGPARATLEVEIWRHAIHQLDLPGAAALALVQMVAVVGLLVVLGRIQERRAVTQRLVAAQDASRTPRGARQWAVVLANLGFMAVLLGTPMVILFLRSVRVGGDFGIAFYKALGEAGRRSTLFVPPVEAVRNSVVFAAIATVIALVVGGLAASVVAARPSRGGRLLDTVLMLPLGTSAVTVGFGFLIALDDPPLDLRSSPALIPIAHAVVAIPFVVRAVAPVLRSIDPRLREAAAVLGAAPRRVWREIDLPIVRRALAVAAGFAVAVSLGEFGATMFIARPDYPTVPIAIYRFLGRPGGLNLGQAMALSTVLMVLTASAILAVERVQVREMGEL